MTSEIPEETLITYPMERARLDVFSQFLDPAGIEPAHVRQVEQTAIALMLTIADESKLRGMLFWLASSWTRQDALQHRWREPYLSTLLPPAWRLAPLHPVDALLQDAAALREPLREKAAHDEADGEADDAEE